jgi:hypothetical protein
MRRTRQCRGRRDRHIEELADHPGLGRVGAEQQDQIPGALSMKAGSASSVVRPIFASARDELTHPVVIDPGMTLDDQVGHAQQS